MKRTMRFRGLRPSFRQTWLFRVAAIAVCATLFAAGLTAPSADGCGWSGYERSLRFPSSSVNKDRLPPLPGELPYPVDSSDEIEDEPFWYFADDYGCGCGGDYEADERFEATQQHLKDALVLIATGDTRGAGKLLERFLDDSAALMRDGFDRYYSTPQQPLRNQAIDLLDVVRERERGVALSAIQTYALVRMRDFTKDQRPDSWPELAEFARRDDRFSDNVAYLNGAFLYRVGRFYEAAAAFDDLVEAWPKSEKREAALLMSGMSCLRFAETAGDSSPDRARTTALAASRSRFEALLREFPRGAFARDAKGWLAHVAIQSSDYPTGLVAYYTMLRRDADPRERVEGVRSLNLVRRRMNDETMLEVERRLERDPEAALAYAYFEIYNDAAWYDAYETMSERQEPFRREGLERIATFASRMADRVPKGGIGAGFALRVTGACVEIDRYDDAAKFAKRALDAEPSVRERHEALYLLATAEHGARRFDSARAAIGRLLAASPDRRMEESARRRLAMICEDDDDLAGALDAYRSLGYEADAAYLIDVLMTLGELQAYIDARPDDPNADWLRYALGVRLLRTGSYDLARIELMKVLTGSSELDRWTNYGTPETEPFAFESATKDPTSFNPAVRLPRQHWLAADLQTASDLQSLRLQTTRPATDEVAAEAQYQYAAYLFDREALLFYNPTLWWGSRTDLLNTFAYAEVFRLPGEGARVWYATNQHDALAQSVDAFLDVVDRYPATPAAADALYSAAVAHERLANFNGYWRSQYENGLHAGRRRVTYEDVRRLYPKYRIPAGTIGWEASTRTVNGGPGWALLPPKPKPVPLWRHYAKRVPEVIAEFGGPVVARVSGWVGAGANWTLDVLKHAAILFLQAILLTTILAAWLAAVRSSIRLALDAVSGHTHARALLPASLAYRTRDYRWLAWAAVRIKSLRAGVSALSITQCGQEKGEASTEPRLDDRLVIAIERARLFTATTPEGLACVLVVVTHLPILVLMAMAM